MDEDIFHYDLMEVIMIRIDTSQESREKIFDYLRGIFTNDKEKIIKQTGPLPDNIMKEVDNMSGVGALIRDTALNEGLLKGQIKALYQYAGFTTEEIAEKLNIPEKEIRKILDALETSEQRKELHIN